MSLSFLFTAWGNPGMLNPLLTAARRLRREGHRVRFLGDADHQEEMRKAGFEHISWRRPAPPTPPDANGEEAVWAELRLLVGQVMIGGAIDFALDTIDTLRRDPVDAVLTNDFLAGPVIAAEALGIPCALLSPHISVRPLDGVPLCLDRAAGGDEATRRNAEQATRARFVELMTSYLPTLNRARAALGLTPLLHVFDHYDRADRLLIGMSGAFDFPATRLPANLRYIGPLLDMPQWAQPWTPPWSGLSERPRILVSLSTSFQDQASLLRRIIAALGTMQVDAVVTTGPAMANESFEAPGNVCIVHSAPHDAVMKEVSLVVTHGGHGTVVRSLLNGVPLLVVPMGRDQGDNAARVVARGAGLGLTDGASEQEIASAIGRLLTEQHFQAAARRLGEAMIEDVVSGNLVSEMEAIATRSWRRSGLMSVTKAPVGHGTLWRLSPNSLGFALVLGGLAALPSFGIDMSLPALSAIGASLGVSAGNAGLTISLFMFGYAIAPPFCGPVSDHVGRKPILVGAVALFAVASLGCAVSRSLTELLAWRAAQGMGAGVGTTLTFAVINDLFPGSAGRAKFAHLASLMLFVPMLAPAAGTAVLGLGDWRSIYFLLAAIGIVLFGVVWFAFAESAGMDHAERFSPATMLLAYVRALGHRTCLGFILVNAGGFGTLFAYISGSALLLIDSLGVTRAEYSVIYAATFLGIMASVLLNGRLSTRGVAPSYPLSIGIALALGSAVAFLVAILLGWTWVPGLVAILIAGTTGFGLIAPNAMHAAMQPLPKHAGAVSAMMGFVQVLAESVSSAVVVAFNDGKPGLSMALSMVFWSAVALLAYLCLARPTEMVTREAVLTQGG